MLPDRIFLNLFLVLSIFLLFPAAMATQYMSFAQPNSLSQKDVYIYNFNATIGANQTELYGMWNTSSSGIEVPEGDFLIVFRPQYDNLLDDPGAWLGSTISWAETNSIALVFIAVLIGFVVARRG